MTRVMRALCLLVTGWAAGACAEQSPVVIQLNFPLLSTFLYAEFARIQAFDLSQDQIGNCPSIHAPAMGGTPALDASLDTGEMPVCDFLGGGITFDEIGGGPKAYVGLVWDATNALLLSGCTVGEAYEKAPPITIVLHMSDTYGAAVERINGGEGPLYQDEREKCEGTR